MKKVVRFQMAALVVSLMTVACGNPDSAVRGRIGSSGASSLKSDEGSATNSVSDFKPVQLSTYYMQGGARINQAANIPVTLSNVGESAVHEGDSVIVKGKLNYTANDGKNTQKVQEFISTRTGIFSQSGTQFTTDLLIISPPDSTVGSQILEVCAEVYRGGVLISDSHKDLCYYVAFLVFPANF